MKLNVLVLTLLMTSLTTDVFPAAKRQASDSSDQAEQPPQKQARTDAPAADAPICSICLQTEEDENGIFMTAEQASQLLTCGHREFHQTCLTQALARKASCPMCRQPAVDADDSEEDDDDAPEITLNESVAQGNLGAVQALLADPGINVNAADAQGNTALHFAALFGHVAAVQALLHAGANVNAADAQRRIPLHWASIGGYVAVVQALIAVGGINVNAADAAGNTPLHTAAEEGRAPVVQALLAAGADRTIRNTAGQTAADIAISPAIRTLIEQYRTPAVGADDSEEDDYAPEITLNEAVAQGNLGAVQALLASPGINVNAADAEENTPLHIAAMQGHVAVVQALLHAGANVNAANAQRRTPLHWASTGDYVAVVQALLADPGINVNAADAQEWTPLHYAAWVGPVVIVQALIDAGANINAADVQRSNPLHIAAVRNSVAVVQALIDAGANINAADAQRRTPLHWAAIGGYVEVVQALLDAGADITIRDDDGQTAAQVASTPEIANLIEQDQPVVTRNARFFNCAIS